MNNRTRLSIAIAVLLTAVATSAVTRALSPQPTAATAARDQHSAQEEVLQISGLKLVPAIAGESWDVVEAAGKVGPDTDKLVKIGPRIPGKIRSVSANVGDTVRRGQVLATISSIELAGARAAYRQAAAKLQAARQACSNQSRLAKLGAFSRRPLEEARAEHTTAQGELAQARSELAENQSELVRAESELAQCVARMQRARELYKDQIISKNDLEAAEAEHKRDSAGVEAAKARIRQTQAKIDQVASRAAIASNYLDREQKVAGSNLLSTRELQAAEAQVTEAKVALAAAAEAIRVLGASPSGSGDTLAIASPISGRVVERNVSLGEMVDPSATLFTVMNLSDVWLEANVFEKDLARVRKGQTAEVRINSYPDRVFTGRVAHVSDMLDAASRTARVRVAVANPAGLLKPEMFASISVITAKRGGAVLVPKQAILDEAGKKVLFAACTDCPDDQKAGGSACGGFDKREVELRAAHSGRVEVASGIRPGDQIVVVGQHQLKSAFGSGQLSAGCADGH